jgi:hypothetical protein
MLEAVFVNVHVLLYNSPYIVKDLVVSLQIPCVNIGNSTILEDYIGTTIGSDGLGL